MTVSILQAADLLAMDSGGTSDPYVKIFFAGEKKFKFKTKVHPKTLAPVFDETFVFKSIPFGDIMAKTLMIQCFDFDRWVIIKIKLFYFCNSFDSIIFSERALDLASTTKLVKFGCPCVKLIWQYPTKDGKI